MTFAQEYRVSKQFTLLVVCIAIFTDVFVYGLVVPVMPFALTQRLGVKEEDVQIWNSVLLGVLGFAIVIGALGFGYLSDHISNRRLPFTAGLLALGSSTVLFALSTNIPTLLIARFLQGLATAIVFTVGFALLFDKVGSESIGQAMGFTSMSLSLGWFLGPVVGGVIYEAWGYYAVFVLPLVLVAIEIVLRVLVIENGRDCKRRSARDVERPEANIPAEIQPLLGASARPKNRNSGVHRSAMPILIASPRFMIGMFGFCVLNGFMVAFDGVLPVYTKELFNFNSEQVSLVFLAMTVPMLLSPLFGALVDKIGNTKWPAVAGLFLTIPGLLLLRLVLENTTRDLITLVMVLILIGISFAIGIPPFAAEVMHVVEDIEDRNPGIFGPNGACAQAYGLTNAGLGVGCVFGPLGVGYIRVKYGWSTSVTCMAALSAVAICFVLPVTGGSIWAVRKEEREQTDQVDQVV
ncbi:MFS amine transporter [Tothia fuscella]|uniref:MFS amine transporter n=1 Tax=Tothia fuscella TaxID=1048955 RepID=A0A9P4TZE9_9PEZI|nr:MFS amine transporter [Tothia fuscella]